MIRLGFIALLFTLGRGFSATTHSAADPGALGASHVFVASGGAATGPGTLSGFPSFARGINFRRDVVGLAWVASSEDAAHAFLPDPQPLATPEPRTAVLAVIGALLVLAGAWRRR